MNENNSIIPVNQNGILPKVSNSIEIINKILAKTEEILIPYRKKDKWGFCKPDKKIVIDCEFEKAYRFTEGLAGVRKNGKWGFINSIGTLIVPFDYDEVKSFNEGFSAIFKSENGWSFIDLNGNAIFRNFDYLADFHDGLAPVLITDRTQRIHYIDKTGSFANSIKSLKFNQAPRVSIGNRDLSESYKYSEGLILVRVNGKFGYYDKKGEVKIQPIYDEADTFSNGVAQVGTYFGSDLNHANSGYIDYSGNFIIPPKYLFQYRNGIHFSEGLELVMEGYHIDYGYMAAKRFYINKNDEVVIPTPEYGDKGTKKYQFLSNFSDGRAQIMKDFKRGFIDINGTVIIDCDFNFATQFSEGLSMVCINGKYGFIDKYGNTVIDPKYSGNIDYSSQTKGTFKDGLYHLFKYGYIDKNGVEYWED